MLVLCFISAPFCRTNDFDVIVGLTLLFTGSLLHVVAKGTLVRNVVLTTAGVYGMVRHPYYLANYLVDISFCTLSGNLYLVLAYPFLFFWAYGPTIRSEEDYLTTQHGYSFISYSLRTPQIFPDRDSLEKWRNLCMGFSWKRVTVREWSRIARFLSIGFSLVLLHELKEENLEGLRDLIFPSRHDYDEFVFLMIAVVLFALSFILMRLAHKHPQGKHQAV